MRQTIQSVVVSLNSFNLRAVLLVVLLGLGGLASRAEVPALFNVQGRLLAGTAPVDGPTEFKFALVSANGSQTYWRNSADANADGQPDQAVTLTLSRGLYSVALGDSALANMSVLPADVFANREVYLRVWVNQGTSGFQALTPDQRITSAGYAMISGTVSDGAITTAKLAPGVLDAANLTGVLSPSRLPSNVVYKDADLQSMSNVLSGRLVATNASLVAKIDALSATVEALIARVTVLSNQLNQVMPLMAAVSSLDPDPGLVSQGFAAITSLAAPGWEDGTSNEAPAARTAHTTIWTGAEMVVWGGSVGASLPSASGGFYDPDEDRWEAVSTIGAPAARMGHSAVWTGSEMLVWGGLGAGAYLNQGGRWKRNPQTWTAMATANVPAGREGHAAVWTGSKMFVWGGRNSSGLLSDGALYDPVMNQWSAVTLAGAPPARIRPSVVWAGNRAIVWGGEGGGGMLNDGAQLLFDTSGAPVEWRPLASAGAPSARARHTAVWTGSRMLIWGGSNGSVELGSGGGYDPAANTWTTIELAGAPSARSDHNALWTGQEMLVIGGSGETGELASGAAYHPVSGQWRLLSRLGNPQPRSGGGAVWIGAELLVFGGSAQGVAVGALERLNPRPAFYIYRKQ